MDVTALCPLPIGISRWQSTVLAMTVVVKATFTLEREGWARLAETQDPLHLDHPNAISDAQELERASDYAPFKPFMDVFVLGHAFSSTPTTRIDARMAIGRWEKRFVALHVDPARRADMALAITDALRGTRARSASGQTALSIDEYVATQVDIDRARRPSEVLAARGISALDWEASRRFFRERASDKIKKQ